MNLKYVLLIGDDDDLPGQKARYIMGSTDHYYRSIDTSDYYTDINGPDLGVGRISAKNNRQLDAIFKKLTKYQIGEFSDENWLDHISFIATDDRYKVAEVKDLLKSYKPTDTDESASLIALMDHDNIRGADYYS